MKQFKILGTGLISSMLSLVFTAAYLTFYSTGEVNNLGLVVIVISIVAVGFVFFLGKWFLKYYPTSRYGSLLKLAWIGYSIWLLVNLVIVFSCISVMGIWPEFQTGRALILGFLCSTLATIIAGVLCQGRKENGRWEVDSK